MGIVTLPTRTPLCLLPTPCHRLDRASQALGIDLWIKRDDLTGFAFGGNKGRKLEYFASQIVAAAPDAVLTCGSIQSNFIRQLAALCAMLRVPFHAVVMDLPYEYEPVAVPGLHPHGANALLTRAFGGTLDVIPNGTWDTLFAAMDDRARQYRRPFVIPVGGSGVSGAYAFSLAAAEVAPLAFDRVIFASSSGSTQVGLAYGLADVPTQVIGIACDPEPELVYDFVRLGESLAELLHVPVLAASDFDLRFDFVGPGYGVPSEAGDAAWKFLARTEGIALDPIYSAKAFAAIMAHAPAGELPGRTLFWHTGGTPAVFAHPDWS
ncbi:MAG: pyridoxal-phosphate dependent enzyme [Fimbriimonadaceae bacterium]|nr:pyridoxal-phosphate dependent enzyme [Fimbriimonadaceae bacterium]